MKKFLNRVDNIPSVRKARDYRIVLIHATVFHSARFVTKSKHRVDTEVPPVDKQPSGIEF